MDKHKLIRRLAELADFEAMHAVDVIKHPDLLKKAKLRQEQFTPEMAQLADRHNAKEFQALCKKYGANRRQEKQVWEDSDFQTKKAVETSTKQRTKLFNFPITSVLRWMGQDLWSVADAIKVTNHFKIDVAEATISAQLRAGRKGTRGEPASLTEEQAAALYAILE